MWDERGGCRLGNRSIDGESWDEENRKRFCSDYF